MANNYDNRPQAPKGARIAFGIFMICFYIAIGLVCILTDVFNMIDHTVSCVVGGILIAYGVWRAYRLYVGVNDD